MSPHWPCATTIGYSRDSKGTDVFRQAHHPVTLLNAPTTTHQLTPTSLWQSAHTAQHERNPVSTLMFKEMSEEKQARFPLKDDRQKDSKRDRAHQVFPSHSPPQKAREGANSNVNPNKEHLLLVYLRWNGDNLRGEKLLLFRLRPAGFKHVAYGDALFLCRRQCTKYASQADAMKMENELIPPL